MGKQTEGNNKLDGEIPRGKKIDKKKDNKNRVFIDSDESQEEVNYPNEEGTGI